MTENLHIEFKEARTELPKSLFDTVCAFLNTDGGTVYLGIKDDGTVSGVEPDAVNRLRRDIANASNNPQKLDPPYLLFPKGEVRDGKTVIVIQVPLSSQIHRHKGEIFLRSEDGDYRVKNTHQLAGLLNRKLGIQTDTSVDGSIAVRGRVGGRVRGRVGGRVNFEENRHSSARQDFV